ncbi:hypothetical protein V0288_01240 [Pannus brasiliensis CCIBt3594]|uniref:Uncharacterized protein n=1 Tax=Pannus brasiliensis CCIBt3594 TaxID=1427578 RepID=A0AAW9QKT1_9CHRO
MAAFNSVSTNRPPAKIKNFWLGREPGVRSQESGGERRTKESIKV